MTDTSTASITGRPAPARYTEDDIAWVASALSARIGPKLGINPANLYDWIAKMLDADAGLQRMDIVALQREVEDRAYAGLERTFRVDASVRR